MSARKIIHVDMDAFFASVEQRNNHALHGHPVAVGQGTKRGVVAAASYEARKFGVRSAMPSTTAMRLCAELGFVPLRFEVCRAVSQQIRAIFASDTCAKACSTCRRERKVTRKSRIRLLLYAHRTAYACFEIIDPDHWDHRYGHISSV